MKHKGWNWLPILAVTLITGGIYLLCVSRVSMGSRYGGRVHPVMGWEKNLTALSILSLGLGIASSYIRHVNAWARELVPVAFFALAILFFIASLVVGWL